MTSMLGLQIIQSNSAVELDGTELKEVQQERGGFWARLFDPDPTLPLWQKTKTVVVQVPSWKPVMYRMMDKLIVHPSLMSSLMNAVEQENKKNASRTPNVFRW